MAALILVAVLVVLAPAGAWAQTTGGDLPLVTIDVVSAEVPEGEDVGFTFSRTGDVTGRLLVQYSTTQDPHQILPGTDRGQRFGEFNFATGSPTFTLTYKTLQDEVARGNGLVTTRIIGRDDYLLPPLIVDRSATVTVIEDDSLSTSIALTANPAMVLEDGGPKTITVTATLDALPRPEATVVQVSVAGITATVVEDFGAVNSFNLTIPARATSGEADFSLTPVNDQILEGAETLEVSGTAALPVTAAMVTISDGAPASTGIELTLDPTSVTEDGGAQTVRVTATLNAGPRDANTVVQVAVAGNTATVVEDFGAVNSFNLTIPAGATSGEADFSLTPVDDALDEAGETLQVSGTATGLTVDPAELTISDDDPLPSVSISDAEADESAGEMRFSVTLSEISGRRVSFVYSTQDGTAQAGSDYAGTTGGTFIEQGDPTKTITVSISDDGRPEPDETFFVQITPTAPVRALKGRAKATGTIKDNDLTRVRVRPAVDPAEVEEGENAAFTLWRVGDTAPELTVDVEVNQEGMFLSTAAPATVTFPPGMEEVTLTLATEDDATAEVDGAVTVQVVPGDTRYEAHGTPARVMVRDNDTVSSSIVLTLDPERVTEQGGQQTVRVTATLNAGARSENTVVQVSVAGNTATAVDDFGAVNSFNLTIPAEATSAEADFSLTPVDDALVEGDETLTVSGTAALPVTAATLTISDDDTTSTEIELTLDPTSVTEDGGAKTVTVTATLNAGARDANTVVQVSVAGNTATVVDDFGAVGSFQVTIPAGDTSAEADFSLTPANDQIAEGAETLTVSGTAALPVTAATLTISDDDTASTGIELTLDPTSVTEDGGAKTVTVTATLNAGARDANTVVQVAVAGNTATVVDDFGAVNSFNLTIPAGDTSAEADFSLTPANDQIAEGAETLTVSGTAALPVTAATLTISDDDTTSTGIELTLDPTSVTEDGGAKTVTVTATLNAGARDANTVVQVSVAGNTATVVDDFGAVGSFQVTIPAGDTSAEADFSLTPANDQIAEGAETLTVSGTAALPVTAATLTISDDDTASTGIELTLDPTSVTEDGGAKTVTVTATLNAGARDANTVVQVAVAGNTATVVDDFGAVNSFNLTIPAGDTSAEADFSLTPANDQIAEGAETLTVSGTAALPVTAATLTISDDDTASTGIELTLDPTSVTEDGGAKTVTVTATLNAGARDANTVVQVSVAGNTATVVDDFGAVNSFNLTIPAGDTSAEADFSLTPANDQIAEGAETLTVSGTAALPVTAATLTISDDDTASTGIELTLDPTSVTEDGGAQAVRVTAALNAGARDANTVVQVAVAGNTATVVDDFGAVNSFNLTIPAGDTSAEADFSLTPANDQIAEGAETLTVSGTAALPVTAATLTISDDDTASTGIELTLDPTSVTEDGGAQAVRVTAALNAGARDANTVVQVAVAGNTATVVDDFGAVNSFNLTIPAGDTSAEADFSLTPANDQIAEGAETLTVSGTAALPVTAATLTISDDDTASTGIELTLDPTSVTEDGGAQAVRVTAALNAGARDANTVVQVAVAGNTATVVDDFGAVNSFNLTIPAGDTSAEADFSLTPANDQIAEGAETLTVSGTAALPVTAATLTISDDDTASTGIELTLDPTSVTEDGGAQAVRVTAALNAGARDANTVVQVAVAGNTATVVDDFGAVGSFQVTIPAGDTSAEADFSLTPANDQIAEGAETLTVSGTAALPVTAATLTISDDDTASTGIELTLDPTSVTEDGGAKTVTVTATLNAGARDANTVVQVAVAGNTATVVDDFGAVNSFNLTIPAGDTSAEADFSLTPANDQIAEGAETLTVSGTAALPVTAATLTISDDDTASTGIELTLDPTSVTEDGGAKTVTVTATLNAGARDANTVVQVAVAGNTATVVDDFGAVNSFNLTIPAGDTSAEADFSLTPANDQIAEGAETLTVSGTAALPVTAATLTISDDDTASTGIELTLDPTSVTEDGGAKTVTVTATLNAGARDANTVVQVAVAGNTATVVDDFGAVNSFNLTIPAGDTSAEADFSLTPANDQIAEGAETLTVSGTAALPVTAATLTISDDDTASTGIELTLDPTSVTEDGGAKTVTVTATLNAGARDANTVVQVSVAGNTATVVDDFGAVGSFQVTIPAGDTSAEADFSLTPANDQIAEGAETLTVSGTAALPVTAATLTISDDDTASTGIELTLDPAAVAEGGGAQTVTVTATLNAGARDASTVVQVSVAGNTATVVEDFWAVNSFNLTIPAGAASAEADFSLTPVNDQIAEGAETLTVSGTAALPVTPATLTISDDDTASTGIELTLDPTSVTEDGGAKTVTVTATLNAGARDANTVVQVSVAGNTAMLVDDFGAVGSFQVTIPAGDTSAEADFSLTPVNDQIAEGDETLQVSGTSTLPVTAATLTIRDDDTASTGIELTLDPTSVTEDGGAQTVRVTAALNAGARDASTVVQVSVAGNTATVVDDFGAVGSFQVAIPAGAASAEADFSLTPANDQIAEGAETLTVSGTAALPVTAATLTIRDDDTASTGIELTLDPTSVTEDGGAKTVTVTATLNAGARDANTVVQVAVAGNTATVVDDFGAVGSFRVTIPAGAASGEADFSLTPANDQIAEGAETLTVSGTAALPVTAATLTISDDDTASTGIELTLDPAAVAEGGGAQTVTVTATLNAGARDASTVVQVSVAGNTATVVDDFGAVNSFNLTIPAGAASAEADFSLTPANDQIAEGAETLEVSGTAALPVTPATLTISDDDTASTGIELTLDPAAVAEGGGAQTVTVTATLNAGARDASTVVQVSVAGNTAMLVDDFGVVGSFQVTIPAGDTSAEADFSLTPANDQIAEGAETLTVSGTAALPVTAATLTISDDDTASTEIELTLDPTSVTEDGGAKTVTVTATLNAGARDANTVVQVAVAGNTATVVEDFWAVNSFNLTIPAGAASGEADFSLTPVNDQIAEGAETLEVSGTAALPVTPATLTISDDDTASTGIELTLDPTSVTEDGGAQAVRVTAALNAGARSENTVVQVAVAGNTATVVDDFGAVGSFQVAIPAGAASAEADFSLTPVNDQIAEGAETLTVSGTAALPVTPATLTISDDDTASTGIELTLDPEQVTEQGGQQTVRVTAALNAGARSENTVVQVAVAGNTATVVDDFGAVNSFNLTIPAGAASGEADFSLTPVNDQIAEGAETLEVSGTAALPVTAATLTISDDDTASTGIELTLDPEQVTEQGGQQTVRVTAALNAGARSENTVVQVAVAGNTATVVDDFGAVNSFNLTIPAGAASGEADFSLTPVDDALAEGTETLMVSGTSALPVTAATLTISDDDTASTGIELTLDPTSVTEDGGAQAVRVTAALNAGARSENTVVQVAVAGNTATVVDDFGAVNSFNLTIPAGAASAEADFSLTPVNDQIAEGAETLTVSGTAVLPVTAATLTISDGPDTPALTVSYGAVAYRVVEGSTVTVTVRLNDAPAQAVVVPLTHTPTASTGASRADYAGVPRRVTFGAAETTQTFPLTATDDTTDDDGETVTLGFGTLPTGLSAGSPAATVVMIIDDDGPNRPPAFTRSRYAFDVVENGSGQTAAVPLGTVKAWDPDGDPVTYALTSGDRRRFALGAQSGVVTYVGPGEDFESEPQSYTLAVQARDDEGLATAAAVVVTVTDVNEVPAPTDDRVETREDTPVVIDVLANDRDPEGDPLQVETVSAAAHGVTGITADGGVAYTPEQDYHGADRFTYVVSDGAGETATGTVTVTVQAVNDAPVAVGVIPDQVVEEGGDAVTVDVTPFFDDIDGDVLTFRAVSSDEAVAAVTLSGAVLTVTPVAVGATTVTVTAQDPGGLTVTQTFGMGVGDRLRAVFEATLAAMGRGHLASARMTLGRRVAARADEPSQLTVMGRPVPLGAAAVRAEAEQLVTNWLMGLASEAGRSREAAAEPGGRSGAPALGLSSLRGSFGVAGGGSDDPLRGTNFLLAWGGADAQAASPSRRWTLWGQGDVQEFRGEPTGTSGYEGDVRTGYLGLDVRLTDRWLAGVSLARSSGAGDWNTGSASGRLTTTLTAIHPYVRWSDGATSVWTMVGGGRGTAEDARAATAAAAGRALELGLGLVEVRRAIGAVGGVQVGLRGDAAWARLSTEEGTGTLDALRVGVNQLRVGVDVRRRRPIRVGNGLELAPFGEVHARRDGGAGQGGNGLELVGGLRVAGGIVHLDAQGRLLTLHSADGYRERGAGVTLSVGEGAQRPGLTLSMSPRWGARASSAAALWQDHVYRDARAASGEERALDGRVAYGVGVGRGRLLTLLAVYGQSQYGRRLQVGTRVGALGGMPGEPLRIELSGERHTRPGSPAEHRMSLAGVITFGGP